MNNMVQLDETTKSFIQAPLFLDARTMLFFSSCIVPTSRRCCTRFDSRFARIRKERAYSCSSGNPTEIAKEDTVKCVSRKSVSIIGRMRTLT
jgi:hypothetical protein